jgi:cell division septation protein DedD
MPDEGFREIQLKGKQLVFLFMAATVVAVVIFLCGVMVGRGVPARAVSAINTSKAADFDARGAAETLPPARAVSTDGSAPVTAQETLTYVKLLEDPDPPAETLAPVEEATAVHEPVVVAQPAPPTPPPAAANPPAVATVAAPAVEARSARALPVTPPRAAAASPVNVDATLAEPPGTGFVVQVAAVRQRTEANALARRLRTKSYPAFVTIAGSNFRVRVGKYDDRREAESVAGRLSKEERITPWITR